MPAPSLFVTDGQTAARTLRIGVLTPSSNTVLEPATFRLMTPLAHAATVHFARFKVTVIADDSTTQTQFELAPMIGAVDLLADARMDAYLWSGTSGSWEGLDQDRALVAEIVARTGAPATTATLALIEAFRGLGVQRYGLVVPYVASIAQRITKNLAVEGYECVALEHGELTSNWEFAAISGDAIASRVRRVAEARPDAIAIHCTNLRGAEVAAALEQDLDMPVLDSVAVGLWGVLTPLGVQLPSSEFGSLASIRLAQWVDGADRD